MEEGKLYNCDRCKKKTMSVTKGTFGVEGTCSSCGYSFSDRDYLQILNNYGGVIAVFVLLLLIISSMMTGGQFDAVDNKINSVNSNFIGVNTDIISINNNITTLKNDIGLMEVDIIDAIIRINAVETDIVALETLTSDIENIQLQLDSFNQSINELWVEVNGISGENIVGVINRNLTITYFANQTGDIRYCHFDFAVSENGLTPEEVKYTFRYPNVNITLLDWTGDFWANDSYKNSYMLHWFGENDYVGAKFNLTWNISDYNTSNLGKAGFIDTLMVNSILVDSPEILEVYAE